jgi:hypothetical protein
MTGILLCTCSYVCQADRTCIGLPRFQARLDAAHDPRRPRIYQRAEACANHLGAVVAAMTTWAHEQDLTDADVTVLIIEPPAWERYLRQDERPDCAQTSGVVFSVIHLGGPDSPSGGTSSVVPAAAREGGSGRPGVNRRLSTSVPRAPDDQGETRRNAIPVSHMTRVTTGD